MFFFRRWADALLPSSPDGIVYQISYTTKERRAAYEKAEIKPSLREEFEGEFDVVGAIRIFGTQFLLDTVFIDVDVPSIQETIEFEVVVVYNLIRLDPWHPTSEKAVDFLIGKLGLPLWVIGLAHRKVEGGGGAFYVDEFLGGVYEIEGDFLLQYSQNMMVGISRNKVIMFIQFVTIRSFRI